MKTSIRYLSACLGVAALFLATGCQSVSTSNMQYLGVPTYPPSNPANIQILRTEPTRPNVRLGEIRAEPYSTSVSVAKIEEAIQKAAAKLGADAVVIVYDQTQVTGAYVTGPWYGRTIQQTTGRVIVGVAIKYQ